MYFCRSFKANRRLTVRRFLATIHKILRIAPLTLCRKPSIAFKIVLVALTPTVCLIQQSYRLIASTFTAKRCLLPHTTVRGTMAPTKRRAPTTERSVAKIKSKTLPILPEVPSIMGESMSCETTFMTLAIPQGNNSLGPQKRLVHIFPDTIWEPVISWSD